MELYPLEPNLGDRRELVQNILRVYRRATTEELRHGLHWYETAHELAAIVGHGDPVMGAGVIAALSANVGWGQNRKMALSMATEGTTKGLPDSLRKAAAVMGGQSPVDVLREGLKTRAFFHNIAFPDTSTMVTIDRHAHDIARGERFGESNRGLSAKSRYAIFAAAYREAARTVGVRPSQMQAVAWTVWTRNDVPSRYRRSNG